MSATEYVHVGSHADILSSGRSVGPGERVPEKELTSEDQHLLDEGCLVDIGSFDDGPSNSETIVAEETETKADLQARARDLEIDGRSKMSADELRAAIADREAEAPAAAGKEGDA